MYVFHPCHQLATAVEEKRFLIQDISEDTPSYSIYHRGAVVFNRQQYMASTNLISISGSDDEEFSVELCGPTPFTVMIYWQAREMVYSGSFNASAGEECRHDVFSLRTLINFDSLWEYRVSSHPVESGWQQGFDNSTLWSLKRNQFPVYDPNKILLLRTSIPVSFRFLLIARLRLTSILSFSSSQFSRERQWFSGSTASACIGRFAISPK